MRRVVLVGKAVLVTLVATMAWIAPTASAAHAVDNQRAYFKSLPSSGMQREWKADFPITGVGRVGTNTLCVAGHFVSPRPTKFTLQFEGRYANSTTSLREFSTANGPVRTCWFAPAKGHFKWSDKVAQNDSFDIMHIRNSEGTSKIYGMFVIVTCGSSNGSCF